MSEEIKKEVVVDELGNEIVEGIEITVPADIAEENGAHEDNAHEEVDNEKKENTL